MTNETALRLHVVTTKRINNANLDATGDLSMVPIEVASSSCEDPGSKLSNGMKNENKSFFIVSQENVWCVVRELFCARYDRRYGT